MSLHAHAAHTAQEKRTRGDKCLTCPHSHCVVTRTTRGHTYIHTSTRTSTHVTKTFIRYICSTVYICVSTTSYSIPVPGTTIVTAGVHTFSSEIQEQHRTVQSTCMYVQTFKTFKKAPIIHHTIRPLVRRWCVPKSG